MKFLLTENERKMISQLPLEIASLADKYPIQLINVAKSWNNQPLSENYIPQEIEVYCGDSDDSSICVRHGELIDFTPVNLDRQDTALSVCIDGSYVYIEIEGKEVLNKLGNVVLPKIIFSPEEIIL